MRRKKFGSESVFFTVQLSMSDYAKLQNAAMGKGMSAGAIVRWFLNALPPVDEETVERWRRYRARGGGGESDKMHMPFSKLEEVAESFEKMVDRLESAREEDEKRITALRAQHEEQLARSVKEAMDKAELMGKSAMEILSRPTGKKDETEL